MVYFDLPIDKIFDLDKGELNDHIKKLEDFYVGNNDDYKYFFLVPALEYIGESLNSYETSKDYQSIKFRNTCLKLLHLKESNNLDIFDIKYIPALVLCVRFCRNLRKLNSNISEIRRSPQNVISNIRARSSNISLT